MLNSTYPRQEHSPKFNSSASKSSPRARKVGENIDESNSVQGLRDVLLVKCKQAIEELHLELEEERRQKLQLEDTIGRLESDVIDKDSLIRDLTYRNGTLQEEKADLQGQLDKLQAKIEDLEGEFEYAFNETKGHRELEENFQTVCKANNDMKAKIEELNVEIHKRDKVVREWNETLSSIDAKIAGLEEDKQILEKENNELYGKIEHLQSINQESETLNQLLQGKCEYSDRLTQQLEKENKLIDELRNENHNLNGTIDRLNSRIEDINEEISETVSKKETTFRSEKEEIERTLRERHMEDLESCRSEYSSEVKRLQKEIDSLQNQTSQIVQERNYLKEDLRTMQEKIQDKEREIKIVNENYSTRWENLHRTKMEEISKLQGIIDDQSGLIASYEKMLENEKADAQDKVNSLLEQANVYKDEIFDLNTKNSYLNTKLQECQEELINIQNEIKNTFVNEEEKHHNFINNINALEQENSAKEEIALRQKDEISQLKSNLRKTKKTLEELEQEKLQLNEELSRLQNALFDKDSENRDLKDQQREFSTVLHSRIEEMTTDIKAERERRIEAEHLCVEYKEQIFTLEGTIRSNASAIKSELMKKEEELEQLKYQKRMESMADKKRASQNLYKRIDRLDRISRSPQRDRTPQQDYSFKNNHSKYYDDEDNEDRPYEHELPQRRSDNKRSEEANVRSSNWQQQERSSHHSNSAQSDVISHFKNVINKLEAKVEKIAHEMNS